MTEHAYLAGNQTTDRPCWHCSWFNGMDAAGNARCIDRSKQLHIMAQPERGCVFFEREAGVDDAPRPPDARIAKRA